MLCQFRFTNFNSYKEEAILDMQAVSSYGFIESLLKSDAKEKMLPVAVIYGPNGGGKSNVLKALNFLHEFIVKPVAYLKMNHAPFHQTSYAPFLFDETSKCSPTEFDIFFRPNTQYEYRYALALHGNKIVSEGLYRRKLPARGKVVVLFERDIAGINLGASLRKFHINTEIQEQMPFLSFLSINYKIEEVNLAETWFEKNILRDYAKPYTEYQLILGEGEAFKHNLIQLMNEVGINISDFKFEKKANDDSAYELIFEHTVNSKKYYLNSGKESNGTQKLFNVLPLVIFALSEGRMLVIDELDAKLHPKLLKYIIMLFKNPKINTHGAQLIFTSHDVSTMKSSVFRTDEIWFAYKKEDESSDLYSLYEIRDENGNHIGQNTAFDKQYLAGRYGADPYFQRMMEWE